MPEGCGRNAACSQGRWGERAEAGAAVPGAVRRSQGPAPRTGMSGRRRPFALGRCTAHSVAARASGPGYGICDGPFLVRAPALCQIKALAGRDDAIAVLVE